MKTLNLFALLLFLSHLSFGQLDVNFELQVYPTGIIPGLRFEKNHNDKSASHIRLGYNWIRHRDLGVQDDERGDGLGFSIGHKRYFNKGHEKWNLGVKNDFWWNTIDWKNEINSGQETSGTTKIVVLQPTLELGYLIKNKNLILSPTVSFGYEWNIKTSGIPTGEGAILLLGLQIGNRFYQQ